MTSEPPGSFSATDLSAFHPYDISPEIAQRMGFMPFPEYKGYYRLHTDPLTLWYHPMTKDGAMGVMLSPQGEIFPCVVKWVTGPRGDFDDIVERLHRLASAS
jgi:hypothetical protein